MLGASTARLVSAATTNATVVKAGRGTLYGWYIWNVNAAARYVKLYDLGVAPTVGTTIPKMTMMIPAGSAANCEFGQGIAFEKGISFATTTGAADSDTAAVALSEVGVTLLFT